MAMGEEPGLKFTYDFRIAEAAEARRYTYELVPNGGWGRVLLEWAVFLLPSFASMLAGAYLVKENGLASGLPILVVAGSALATYWLLGVIQKNFSLRALGSFEGAPIDIEFSEEGVRVTAPSGKSLLYWTAIQAVVQKPDCIYLITRQQQLVLPKRSFANEDVRRQAVDWMSTHLTQEALARSTSLKPKSAG